jgi:hypothetical protein
MVLLIAIVSTIIISFRCGEYRSAPRSILRLPFTLALLMLFTPGLVSLMDISSKPNLSQLLLLLSNDIESNPGPNQPLNILFTNINSLTAEGGKRLVDLSLRMKSDNIHIACLSESGRNLNHVDMKIDGYCTFKPDHSLYEPRGRGLLIYVHESLIFSRCYDLELADGSCIWIKVKANHRSLLLGLFYRSPSQSPAERDGFLSNLDKSINKASAVNADAMVLGGDFNARSKFWWGEDINTIEGTGLYDVSVKHSLTQFIHEPTRITSVSKTCLDLVFSNSPGYVLKASVNPPISLSDHSSTLVSMDITMAQTCPLGKKKSMEIFSG